MRVFFVFGSGLVVILVDMASPRSAIVIESQSSSEADSEDDSLFIPQKRPKLM